MKYLVWALLIGLSFGQNFPRPGLGCPSSFPEVSVLDPYCPPSTIRIGKDKWRVVCFTDESLRLDNQDFVGYTIDQEWEIPNLPPKYRKGRKIHDILIFTGGQNRLEIHDTVVHELEHAIVGTEASLEKKTVHEYIEQFSEGWAKIMWQNPDLVRWLGDER